MTMRAALMHSLAEVSVEQIAEPKLDPQGAILRLEACGICGTDARTFFNGDPRAPYPWVLGHEPVGRIEEIGPKAVMPAGVGAGDRVFLGSILTCGECEYCLAGKQNLCRREELYGYRPHAGAFADFAAVPPIGLKNLLPVPPNLSPELATVADPLACALNGIEMLAPRMGDSAVIIGAGPIGCMHAVMLRDSGVARLYMLEVSKPRLELALSVVGSLIDDAWVPGEDNGVAAVMERTGGRGADRVIVAAPSIAGQQAAMRMAAPAARLVFFAGLPKNNPIMEFDANLLHYKELAVLGSYGATPRQYQVALEMLDRRRDPLEKIVTSRRKLDQIAAGFAEIKAGTALKVVVVP